LLIQPLTNTTADKEWAAILSQMYQRWAVKEGLRYYLFYYAESETYLPGNIELPSATYGLLQRETGIHTLCAPEYKELAHACVVVCPSAPEEYQAPSYEEFQLQPTRGVSWMHLGYLNRISKAVRVTHRATGISAACDEERSQRRNIMRATQLVRCRVQSQESQPPLKIRTYTKGEHPFVRDHQTGLEHGDTAAILNGDLNSFLRASIRQPLSILGL
jgi:peptide chain release factor 2